MGSNVSSDTYTDVDANTNTNWSETFLKWALLNLLTWTKVKGFLFQF